MAAEAAAPQLLDQVYRQESRRILATLIRLLGDFERAEEALHDAFAVALEQWVRDGVPDNPRAWLVSTARFRGIDRMRRQQRYAPLPDDAQEEWASPNDTEWDEPSVNDNHLRLIFTCCHPALAAEARVALTLREVCGLSTEDIAAAFLSKPATLAQRIVRAKSKIRSAGIPYEIPAAEQLPARLASVLQVIYLVFNEGYSASSGEQVLRTELCDEALRLGRLLWQLLPEPEVAGLLALMLIHHARRAGRVNAQGDLVLLEHQDRSLWERDRIEEGALLVEQALKSGRVGPYALQAAIAALHAQAPCYAQTDWAQIVGLYGLLYRMNPSPVIALNRAVALAMRDGPAAGLAIVDALFAQGELREYHLAHAARADFLLRLRRVEEARLAYTQALKCVIQEPERRFLWQRLNTLMPST